MALAPGPWPLKARGPSRSNAPKSLVRWESLPRGRRKRRWPHPSANRAIAEQVKKGPLAKERTGGSSAEGNASNGIPLVPAPNARVWGEIQHYAKNTVLADETGFEVFSNIQEKSGNGHG